MTAHGLAIAVVLDLAFFVTEIEEKLKIPNETRSPSVTRYKRAVSRKPPYLSALSA
jgi:hypothetical protein